ncbi:uncharacterized protein PRCAT00005235001 [Priceomyces carsonii]|uniref:uncharacterized protein n=1 Tax=Priceomyces carsonii TaxID=28549 RepID=UPI002ED91839|nr:unnamed protein product [Priceomyces carsonii]
MLLHQVVIALVCINVSLSYDEIDFSRGSKNLNKRSKTWLQTAVTKRNGIELIYRDNDLYSQDDSQHEIGSMTPVADVHSSASPVPHYVAHHQHGVPILETDLLPEEREWWTNFRAQKSYFNGGGSTAWLWAHILFVWGDFIFLYPLTLVLNNSKRYTIHLGILLLHSASISAGVFSYRVFIETLPNQLYPGNVYHKMTFLLFAGNLMTITFAITRYIHKIQENKNTYNSINSNVSHMVLHDLSRHDLHNLHQNYEEFRDSESILHSDNDSSEELPLHHLKGLNKSMNKLSSFLENITRNYVVASVVLYLGSVSSLAFSLLQWGQLIYFCIYMPTGVATFLVLGKGKAVFNLLAHFIKGEVFLLYGILTLSRYCGGFSHLGWAWNHKFVTQNDLTRSHWNRVQSSGLCSMEMVECIMIFIYGSTNVFLEHLSNAGKPFSAKDLQHASLAFIFIGCGLCGVLTEIKSNQWRKEQAIFHLETYLKDKPESDSDIERVIKASPGFSPNPFPILTIFWTGYLMSKHAQELMLSTEIHNLWGMLFMFGCAFRLVTYLLVIISPVRNSMIQPGKPITELLVSFSLLCGGLILMESSDPVIQTLELHGYTSMFILNVSLGFVTLFMAWQMSLMSLRDWLKI